jgi:hypothetical protein
MFEAEIAQAELQKAELIERLQRLKADSDLTADAISRAEAELNQLLGYAEALEKISRQMGGNEKVKTGTSGESVRKRPRNPKRESVVDAALMMITEAGKPLSRQHLFDALSARGLTIQGKDPLMVFSTMLWRTQDRITRLRGHGYWPSSKPYAPANYFPKHEQPTLL